MSSMDLLQYTLTQKIGVGAHATVYKAVRKDGSLGEVAIKCVNESAINNGITEVELLKKLKHENIIEMKTTFWERRRMWIVMEFCDGGDLSNLIKQRHMLPEDVCHKILQQLALALKYLREHNIAHMDLKPQNLLLVKKSCLKLKVADFGLAQCLSNSEYKSSMRGSPPYMAPEILLKQMYDARVDLWSVGVILYECLFGRTPYPRDSFELFAEKIKEQHPIEIPKTPRISDECKDLLLSLLKYDPKERISFENFFSHAFFDLEHAPTTENYKKAVEIVQEAIDKDNEKKFKEAFHLYCEALRYFIPLLNSECNPRRKEYLRLYVIDYMNRAEKLKPKTVSENDAADEKVVEQAEDKGNTSTSQRVHSLNKRSGFCFQELRILSKSTTAMFDALEIGEVGEQYFLEGNYALALEKFQSSLGILISLQSKEPLGRRKDLLYKQVQLWMEMAENTKVLLATKSSM